MSTLTFVTKFVDEKHMDILADSRVQVYVFVPYASLDVFETKYRSFENIKYAGFSNDSLYVHTFCKGIEYMLPKLRNEKKDTAEYMLSMYYKYDFLEAAIAANPWQSTHFAWLDPELSDFFSMHSADHYEKQLWHLSKRTWTSRFLAIPGYSNKTTIDKAVEVVLGVRWRFYSNFLIGDSRSILELVEQYKLYFPRFLNTYGKLVWDMNFLAWLETTLCSNPTWHWYSAKHDPSILRVPPSLYSTCLWSSCKKMAYNYPNLKSFTPSSASHVFYKGNHILNTRYVNYSLHDNGYYHFNHPAQLLITKNVVSVLNEGTLIPEDYKIMEDETVDLKETRYTEQYPCKIFGLEDIRLYEFEDRLRFIATNRNYAPVSSNRMIVGDYDFEGASYSNCRVIDSPNNSQYEKNWIPIIHKGQELFIYNWSPMEIGKINYDSNAMDIVLTHTNTAHVPHFEKVRGSTLFLDAGDSLVGLVHFSEEKSPREYFHMLVSLDKETLRPLRYSEVFHFQHIGIEFCIGFSKSEGQYRFWISRMDRNPLCMDIDASLIPLCFEF